MAKQIINIPSKDNCKEFETVGNSMSTYFKVNKKGELVVKWKREVKTFPEFTEGMTVTIDCWGSYPNIYKFEYPKNPYKIISMLFGYPSIYPDRESYKKGEEMKNRSYCYYVENTVGLFGRYYDSEDKKIEFKSLYQAEGEVDRILLLDKTLTMKEFKKGLKEVNKKLEIVDKEDDFTSRLPDDGLLIDYMKKYKWYLRENRDCSYIRFFQY